MYPWFGVCLLDSIKSGNCFIIKLQRGEKIIESLQAFCKLHNVSAGHFKAIGAVEHAELAHYRVDTKQYSTKIINEQLEIASLAGFVTFFENAPHIHAHIVVSDSSMKAYAGHLKEAVVSATCEIVLTHLDAMIGRQHDAITGLNLLNFQYNENVRT